MTATRAEVSTCPRCHAPIGRVFRFCPSCAETVAPVAAVCAPTQSGRTAPEVEIAPPRVVSPRITPVVAATEIVRPTEPQGRDPRPRPPVGAGRRPPLSTTWRLGIGGLVLAMVVGVMAASRWWTPKAPETVELRVDATRWQSVDLRAKLGAGKPFVVLADVPLRLRTATGRPITTASGPVSLGDLTDGTVEVKAVSGTARVTFAAR